MPNASTLSGCEGSVKAVKTNLGWSWLGGQDFLPHRLADGKNGVVGVQVHLRGKQRINGEAARSGGDHQGVEGQGPMAG